MMQVFVIDANCYISNSAVRDSINDSVTTWMTASACNRYLKNAPVRTKQKQQNKNTKQS